MVSRLARSIKECERFLSPLNLPLLFQPRDRYEVRSASPPMAEHAGGGSATDDRVTRSRPYTSPANEGWPAAPIGSTVLHCPLDISGPSLPAHPRPLFPLRSAEQAHGTGTPWNVSLDGCRISTHVSAGGNQCGAGYPLTSTYRSDAGEDRHCVLDARSRVRTSSREASSGGSGSPAGVCHTCGQ